MLIDCVTVVLFVILFAIGWHRGFVKIAFGLFSFIIAIALAWNLSPIITAYLSETPVALQLEEYVYERMAGKEISDAPEEENVSEAPELLHDMEEVKSHAENEIRTKAAEKTTKLILDLLSMIIIVVLTKLLMLLMRHIFNAAASLPVIRFFNRLLGGGVGLMFAFCILSILFVIFSLMSSTPLGEKVMSEVRHSTLAHYIFDYSNFIAS